MKTKQEFNELKKEVKTRSKKLFELNENELSKVSGDIDKFWSRRSSIDWSRKKELKRKKEKENGTYN